MTDPRLMPNGDIMGNPIAPGNVPPVNNQTGNASEQQVMSGNASPDYAAPQLHPAVMHHAILGGAVKRIAESIEGKQTEYIPNPITGEIEPARVQRKPGQYFRDLLLGAAMGSAAGMQAPLGSGAWGGFMTGMAAQSQNQRALQQQQKDEAFGVAQRAKAEGDKKQAKLEAKQKEDAVATQTQLSHMHGVMAHLADGDRQSEAEMDSFSSGNQALLDAVGNKALPVDLIVGGKNINNQTGNGKALAEAEIKKRGSVMNSPDPSTFLRYDYATYDKGKMKRDGLKYEGTRWVDKNGQPVDTSMYMKHNVRDVPLTALGSSVNLPNSAWNTINRSSSGQPFIKGDPTATSSGTLGQAHSLNTRATATANSNSAELFSPAKNKDEAIGYVTFGNMIKKKIADGEEVSDDDKERARVKGLLGQDWLDTNRDVEADKESDKQFAKHGEFPTFGAPEKAVEYADQAREQLKMHPEATEDKKSIWREASAYGDKMANRIARTIASASGMKAAADTKAREQAQAPDPSMLGPKGLVPVFQDRFNRLPPNLQQQLTEIKSGQIAALFNLADGVSKNTFSQAPRPKSGDISRSVADGWAAQINPGFYSPRLADLREKVARDYLDQSPTKPGGKLTAFNNLLEHSRNLAEVAEEWKTKKSDTGTPLINTALKDIRKQVGGDTLVTKLMGAMTAPDKEYMNVLNQGHAEQNVDRQRMDAVFNENSTPAQIVTGLQQYATIAVDQLDSYDQPMRSISGRGWPNLISPAAKQAAHKFGLGAKVAKYGSGGIITQDMLSTTPPTLTPAAAPYKFPDGSIRMVPPDKIDRAKELKAVPAS